MKHNIRLALLTLLLTALHSRAKILRNNALMTKMITHFQQDNNLSIEPTKQEETPANSEPKQENPQDNQKPEKILSLMQNVLCRNFPSIPCNMIMQDSPLNKLIERSIQQLSFKKYRMDKTTPHPHNSHKSATVYPVINSEDLSNFLEVSHTGYFNENAQNHKHKKKKRKSGVDHKLKNYWSHEKPSKKMIKGSKNSKRGTELYSGRKKMRKFYPHKIKYKDKSKNNRGELRETEEKMSMSVEMPELNGGGPPQQQSAKGQMMYKMEQSDAPVWRIDYMKHGVPSLDMFGYEDERLRGKLMKSGPNVVVDENGMEKSVMRKEVLHPDVYIKKNFVRKNTAVINSDVMD